MKFHTRIFHNALVKINNLLIRDFHKWLPSNKWRHCWGTEQTGTNDVTEYQAENHL